MHRHVSSKCVRSPMFLCGPTRALLRLERTMNSLCHLREGGEGREGGRERGREGGREEGGEG